MATPLLRYLGRYTHRVAIRNQRLLRFDGQRVSFRWKDNADGNMQRIMTYARASFCAASVNTCCPKAWAASATLDISPMYAGLIYLHWLASSLLEPPTTSHFSDSPSATLRYPGFGANMLIGPNLSAQQLRFDENFPTLPDSNSIQALAKRYPHGSATCLQCELTPCYPFLLACTPQNPSHVRSYRPRWRIRSSSSGLFILSMQANSRPSTIAASATASVFLLVPFPGIASGQ